jgi:hypothetical protein
MREKSVHDWIVPAVSLAARTGNHAFFSVLPVISNCISAASIRLVKSTGMPHQRPLTVIIIRRAGNQAGPPYRFASEKFQYQVII